MIYLTGSDASNPDSPLPGDVACGYVGGRTPHVWTLSQWKMQTAKYLLPIWVADPSQNPKTEAANFIAAMAALGVKGGVAYMLDAELLPPYDQLWISVFADRTARSDYGCHPYGSKDIVFTWPPRSGYIVADRIREPHMYEHPFVKGTQWKAENSIDLDLFDPTMKFWENPYVH